MFGKLLLLPPPPAGCTGFPWTAEVPPHSYKEADYPKITIVTPSYNQGQYIEQTIRSVILQNYPNLEYIVIDGGSTDNTIEILKKYDQFITYWVSEPDKGQSDAINKGITRATGDVFNWLNSDDYYSPNALLTVSELFMKNAANVVCTSCNYVDKQGNIIKVNPPTHIYPTWVETLGQAGINQLGMFFRLDRIKQLGGVNTHLHYSMDWEMWLRYLLQFGQDNIIRNEAVTANFRLHDDSKTVQSSVEVHSNFDTDMWNVYRQLAQRSQDKSILASFDKMTYSKHADYQLNIGSNPQLTPAVIQQTIHIYFFTLVLKYFYLQHFKQANFFSSLISQSMLPAVMQKDLAYLRRRIFFKKWFSKY